MLTVILIIFTAMINTSVLSTGYTAGTAFTLTHPDDFDRSRLMQMADKYGVCAYTSTRKVVSADQTDIVYYTVKKNIPLLQKKLGLHDGVVRSGIFQDLHISFQPFSALDRETPIFSWAVIGSNSTVNDFIKAVGKTDGCSVVRHAGKFDLQQAAPFLLYLLFAAIMLLSSYTDALFQKKEVAIRVLHGDAPERYFARNVLADAAVHMLLTAGMFLAAFHGSMLLRSYQMLAYASVLLAAVNALMYLPLIFVQPRETIAGSRNTKRLSTLISGVKAGSAVLAVCVITAVSVLLPELGRFRRSESFFRSFDQHMILNFLNTEDAGKVYLKNDTKAMKEISHKRQAAICAFAGDPAYEGFCISGLSVPRRTGLPQDAVYCNFRAMPYLKQEIPELKDCSLSDYDCILLIPDRIGVDQRTAAVQELMQTYRNVEKHNPAEDQILKLSYSAERPVIALEVQGSVQFFYPDHPVICIAADTASKYHTKPDYSRFAPQMLFRAANEEQANAAFQDTPVRVIGTNAYEQYRMDLHHYEALMIASGILAGLILLFHISVTAVLIRLEYSLNAKEIAVKRILGYSVFSKNRNLFLRSAAVFALLLIAEILFAVRTQRIAVPTGILITVILYAFDTLLLLFHILKTERKQLVKILKGGAL